LQPGKKDSKSVQEIVEKYVPLSKHGRATTRIYAAARIAAWGLATAIIVLSVVPPGLRPETGVPHSLEHFLIYAVTGCAFGLVYS